MQGGEPSVEVRDKWRAPAVAQHYHGGRFASERAAGRDPERVARLLVELDLAGTLVLDAPCGAGRLFDAVERAGGRPVGLDVAAAMLAEARGLQARLVRGDIAQLPFRDGAFRAVVCCRLLHHLHGAAELERAVAELVRVAREMVIASFWDAASLPAWRVRAGLKRSEGPRGRCAIARPAIAAAFERAGARVERFDASVRFVTQQTFVLARKHSVRA